MDADIPPLHARDLPTAWGRPWLHVRLAYRPDPSWHPLDEGRVAARYLYTGPDGEPRHEVLRCRAKAPGADPDKQFVSRGLHPATGEWGWGVGGVDLVPYHLPRVIQAVRRGETVWVVEGEKDVHALEAAGLAATCNPLGGLQWRDAYSRWLRGARVVVIPDEDPVGRVHAGRVVHSLRGVAASVALVRLPGVGEGGDVSDWLAQGHGADELRALAAAAPADPSPPALAEALGLPAAADLGDASPENVMWLVTGRRVPQPAAGAGPPFGRARALFERLGVRVPDSPDVHALFRASLAAARDAEPELRKRLDDALALDRARYELAVFGGLLAGGPPSAPPEVDEPAVMLAPSVRFVEQRWDWDAWLARGDADPPQPGPAFLLQTGPAGVRMRRLDALPALVLRQCDAPRTPAALAAALAARADADPARLQSLVAEQVEQLIGAGVLQRADPDPSASLAAEAERMLTANALPLAPGPALHGTLSRAVSAAREWAERVESARGDDADAAFAVWQMDTCVSFVEEALARAKLRPVFAEALDGYWRAGDAGGRVVILRLLLDVLERGAALRAEAPPPLVLA